MHRGYAGEILSSLSFVSRLNLSKSYPPLLVFNLLFLPFLDFFYLILNLTSLAAESVHFSLNVLVVNVNILHFFFYVR